MKTQRNHINQLQVIYELHVNYPVIWNINSKSHTRIKKKKHRDISSLVLFLKAFDNEGYKKHVQLYNRKTFNFTRTYERRYLDNVLYWIVWCLS